MAANPPGSFMLGVLAALLSAVLGLCGPEDRGATNPSSPVPPAQILRIELLADTSDISPQDLEVAGAVIQERLRALGLTAQVETRPADRRLVVVLPVPTSNETLEQALALMQRPARLTFQLVAPSAEQKAADDLGADDLESISFDGGIIAQVEVIPEDAFLGEPALNFTIELEHRDAFASFTAAHIGRRLAIVVDGAILSSPVIRAGIRDAGVISGLASLEEAQTIALALRVGTPLPVPFLLESIATEEP